MRGHCLLCECRAPDARARVAAEFKLEEMKVELERVNGLLIAETAKSFAAMTLARKAEDELQRMIGESYAKFFKERADKESKKGE